MQAYSDVDREDDPGALPDARASASASASVSNGPNGSLSGRQPGKHDHQYQGRYQVTKKDYQALARAIHAVSARWPAMNATALHERTVALHETRDAIADVLADDNPRFDRERFVEACETGRCKGMPR